MDTALSIPSQIPQNIIAQWQQDLSQIQLLLPKDITPARFAAGWWLQFSLTPDLATCTPASLARAAIRAATLGLEPGRDCCILAFRSRKKNCMEATLVEEYQGVLRRLDRTGRVAWAKAEPVFQRDHFLCDELAENYEFRRHLGGDRGHLLCYVSAVKLHAYHKPLVRVCTIEEVDELKKNMGRAEYETWTKWPHEMGKKTALKRHAKYLRLLDEEHEDQDEPRDMTAHQAQQTIAELWGEPVDVYTGEVLTPETVPDAPESSRRDAPADTTPATSQAAHVPPDPPGRPEGNAYAEWVSLCMHHATNNDIPWESFVEQCCTKWTCSDLRELTVAQRAQAHQWLTTDGGRTYLRKMLDGARHQAGADVPE